MEHIKAIVEEVKYPSLKDDDGETGTAWYVITMRVEGRENFVFGKGDLPKRPVKGTRLELFGEWVVWNATTQFRWEKVKYEMPLDERQRLNYACELTKGLGDAMAQRIWDVKGEDWRNVEAEEVKGLTERTVELLRQTIRDICAAASYHDTMIWMRQHGLSHRQAGMAFDRWTEGAQAKVESDPYILIELEGVGFSTVDERIAPTFSIERTDPRRLKAAMKETVRELSEKEGAAVSWKNAANLFYDRVGNVAPEDLEGIMTAMMERGEIVRLDGETIALGSVFFNELTIYRYAMS